MRGRRNTVWEQEASRLAKNSKRIRRTPKRKLAPEDRLSASDILAIMERQDFCCAVTGISFEPNPKGEPQPFQPSLDRIDNDEGYLEHNVRVVILLANYAMARWGEEPLRTLLRIASD